MGPPIRGWSEWAKAHCALSGGATGRGVDVKVRGAGLTVTAAPLLICSTARPRSFSPSARKRNTPSAPLKPDELVSVASEKRCDALRAGQRRDERDRVIGQRRDARRIAAELGPVALPRRR